MGIQSANPSDEPARLRSGVYFSADPTTHYGREFLVPPHSQRWSWCPVRVPELVSGERSVVEVRSVGDDLTGGGETRLPSPDGGLWFSKLLSIHPGPNITGAIFDASSEEADGEAFQLILALRESVNLSPRMATFESDFLPSVAEGLDMLGQLVICGDRPAEDAAGRAAIRDWLRGGGRLWIMLDRVRPETVRMLLGETACYETVDRVELSQVNIYQVVGNASFPIEVPQEFDDPVELVRVLVADAEVIHTVNGWPASFSIPVGRGQVLFTTLGPRGWMRLRTDKEPPPAENTPAQFVALTPLHQLARDYLLQPPVPDAAQQAARVLTEQVGYRIPGRAWVVSLLSGFCLLVVVCGIWLARREKLERMGWIGPLAGAATAAVFVGGGMLSRHSIPPTVAVFQQAEIDCGGEEADVRGLTALYQPEPGEALPSAERGGLVWPDRSGLEGEIHRLVWTDTDAWHWERLTVPAGIRLASLRQTVKFDAPVLARGTFGPEGFSGALAGPLGGRSDSVLRCDSGRVLAVRFDENGDFSAGPADELAPGQYLAAGLLTDEQRRRQTIYEQVLPVGVQPPHGPCLYFWTELFDLGFTAPVPMRQAGSALVAVPLRVTPVPPGTQVLVPSPFLVYRALQLDDAGHSSAYINQTRQWVELPKPAETWLRFQLPAAVLPLKPDRAVLSLDIEAPSRPVDVLARSGAELVVLGHRQGPHGKLSIAIDRGDVLRPDSTGGIQLAIRVGEDAANRSPARDLVSRAGALWKITSVALEVAGQVEQPRPNRRPE